MATSETTEFTHKVESDGPAQGMTFSGRSRAPAGPVAADTPLIIALPGGTYSSAYFDVPGYSLLDLAGSLGIPALAIDRPSYGRSTRTADSDSIILANAEVLDHLIGELWAASGAGTAGVVLIGHSIGGAVVTAIAASRPAWPLLGIAVSGCLLQVAPGSGDAWAALPEEYLVELPGAVKDFVMFGPDWTHSDAMPEASHIADAPVPKAELLDITSTWLGRLRPTAAQVAVPVHSRQGEFDHLWITDAAQVADFGAVFTGSPLVDAKLVRGSGHCIDFHRGGRAFQLEQLAFALSCCLRPDETAEAPADLPAGGAAAPVVRP